MIFDILLDTIIDSIRLLPFLFFTYILMEYLEHKMGLKARNILKTSEKTGPLWGAILGMLPQCGFCAAASNLYAGRIITVGTLVAIYLSTSDEMLPILISESVSYLFIIKILFIKVLVGMIAGYIIDFTVLRRNSFKNIDIDIHHFCEHEHCHCGNGIVRPAIKHTLQIFSFIFIISFLLNAIIEVIGIQVISNSVLNKPILGELLAGLIGLIPNCAASIVITQLFIDEIIPFGTMMSGLLVGAGVGILVLFKVNDNKVENIKVVASLYMIGVVTGIIINNII